MNNKKVVKILSMELTTDIISDSKSSTAKEIPEISNEETSIKTDPYYESAIEYKKYHDYKRMEDQLLKSIDKHKNPMAMYDLGQYYSHVYRFDEAEHYLKMALEYKYDHAINALAIFYEKNGKVKESSDMYLLAIEKGDSYAMYNYASVLYHSGDIPEAKKYFQMAADKKNADSARDLGNLYFSEGDEKNGIKYLLLAFEYGNNYAMHNLGYNYEQKKEFDKMEECYEKAIEKGVVDSMYNMGIYKKKSKTMNDAVVYFSKAASKGDQKSTDALISHYVKENNIEEALKYCFQGFLKGHTKYMFKLNDLLRDSTEFKIDIFVKYLEYLDPYNYLILNEYLEVNPTYVNDCIPVHQIDCITCKKNYFVAVFLTNDKNIVGKVCRKCFIDRLRKQGLEKFEFLSRVSINC